MSISLNGKDILRTKICGSDVMMWMHHLSMLMTSSSRSQRTTARRRARQDTNSICFWYEVLFWRKKCKVVTCDVLSLLFCLWFSFVYPIVSFSGYHSTLGMLAQPNIQDYQFRQSRFLGMTQCGNLFFFTSSFSVYRHVCVFYYDFIMMLSLTHYYVMIS